VTVDDDYGNEANRYGKSVHFEENAYRELATQTDSSLLFESPS